MRLAIGVLSVFIVSVHAGPRPAQQGTATISRLRDRIPAANPSRYRDLRDAKDWRNPYLVVHTDGVKIQKRGDDYSAPIVPIGEVLETLEKLPASNWPYGLVVSVQENSICGGDRDGVADCLARMRTNRLDLVNRLQQAGILVKLWPS